MLNKELCYNCRKKLSERYSASPYEDSPFEIAWKEGFSPCPYNVDGSYISGGYAVYYDRAKLPPPRCPYFLEHIVSS